MISGLPAFPVCTPFDESRAMQNDLSNETDAMLTHRLTNQLAAIRSAAEILRDVPELGPDDRRHFAAVVLEGERHLETLLPRLTRRRRTTTA